MKTQRTEHVILWEFVVQPGREADFEAAYSPAGAWARLFALSPDFLGTELLHSKTHARRYMTLDRWASAESFQHFRETHDAEYLALDKTCSELTENEVEAGAWLGMVTGRF